MRTAGLRSFLLSEFQMKKNEPIPFLLNSVLSAVLVTLSVRSFAQIEERPINGKIYDEFLYYEGNNKDVSIIFGPKTEIRSQFRNFDSHFFKILDRNEDQNAQTLF